MSESQPQLVDTQPFPVKPSESANKLTKFLEERLKVINKRSDAHKLNRIAEDMRTGSYDYNANVSDEELNTQYRSSKEEPISNQLAKLLDRIKPQMNGAIALLTGEAWNKYFRKERNRIDMQTLSRQVDYPPYSLIGNDHQRPDLAFETGLLKMFSKKNFDIATQYLGSEIQDYPTYKGTTLETSYKRLKQIAIFYDENNIAQTDGSPMKFFANGAGTATDITWAMIGSIPKLSDTIPGFNLTPQTYQEIVSNSYHSLIGPLSRLHLDLATPEMSFLIGEDGLIDPQYLELIGIDEEKPRVKIKDEVMLQLIDKSKTTNTTAKVYKFLLNHPSFYGVLKWATKRCHLYFEKLAKPTTWCPANFAVTDDQKSVNEAFFAWEIELAENTGFFRKHGTPPPQKQ